MAHWAKIDKNNIVIEVVVTPNDFDDEGYQWLVESFGGRWLKTSYNARIRKNFAGVGYTYDEQRDAFIPPKPFSTWILDEETCSWIPPIPVPSDAREVKYRWNDRSGSWDKLNP